MEIGVSGFKLLFVTGSEKKQKPLKQGGQRQHNSFTLKVVYLEGTTSNFG
jgi:hypothetical protein